MSTLGSDVVMNAADAHDREIEPLIILEPLAALMNKAGLGAGPLTAQPVGAGHSNVTYLLDRGAERFVLRRPPRGPLAPSTHDMLREARLLRALARAGVRVPEVLEICEDTEVIGAPFYVMAYLEGHVLDGAELPAEFTAASDGAQIAEQLVDALVELHSVDISDPELAAFGRPVGYLGRQVRRFRDLWAKGATRSVPTVEQVGAWLGEHLPEHSDNAMVHGDYRLGNVMFAPAQPPRIVALLDWEMATLGDPLADLGYLTAMWAQGDDPADPMLELSSLTRAPGFPTRDELAERYAVATGRNLKNLVWYQTLALWKACIFLEGSYGRFLAGSTNDPYFAHLGEGVPRLAERALALTR